MATHPMDMVPVCPICFEDCRIHQGRSKQLRAHGPCLDPVLHGDPEHLLTVINESSGTVYC